MKDDNQPQGSCSYFFSEYPYSFFSIKERDPNAKSKRRVLKCIFSSDCRHLRDALQVRVEVLGVWPFHPRIVPILLYVSKRNCQKSFWLLFLWTFFPGQNTYCYRCLWSLWSMHQAMPCPGNQIGWQSPILDLQMWELHAVCQCVPGARYWDSPQLLGTDAWKDDTWRDVFTAPRRSQRRFDDQHRPLHYL